MGCIFTMQHPPDDSWNESISTRCKSVTAKPFNLADLNVGDFACKIILALFILAN